MSFESVMPSNHLILCRPLLLPPSIFPSIRVFYNESVLRIRWPKYWSFSFSIIPSKEIPGLISFRMDWLDLLAVQGTLKSLLQHLLLYKRLWDLQSWVETRKSGPFSFWEDCCCCLVTQSCQTLWDPMDYSTPDFPVLHHLPEPPQTHVH